MQGPAPDPFAALRLVNYRRFALGWFLATFALRMQGVAILFELFERTNSKIALGYVGLAQAVPVVLLALVGGHTADVHDRKRIIFFSQLAFFVSSVCLGLLSLFQGPVPLVYLCLVFAGAAKAFNSPARGAILPQLVPAETFHNVVTWNSSFFQIAAIGGPLAAGLILAWSKTAWPICFISAAGSLAFAISISGVAPRPSERVAEPRSLKTMLAGFHYLWHEQTVLAVITLDLFAVLLGGAMSLLPVYAKDILHVGPVGLGWLNAAPYVGALIAAQLLARRHGFTRAGPTFLWSVIGFGVGTIAFGLSTNFWLSLATLVFIGATDGVSVVIRHVLVQSRTPDALRGRVAAVNSVFIECSNELGGFESGLVAQLFSPVISVVSGGIGTVVVVIGIALLLPPIRKLADLRPQED